MGGIFGQFTEEQSREWSGLHGARRGASSRSSPRFTPAAESFLCGVLSLGSPPRVHIRNKKNVSRGHGAPKGKDPTDVTAFHLKHRILFFTPKKEKRTLWWNLSFKAVQVREIPLCRGNARRCPGRVCLLWASFLWGNSW